MVPRTTAAAQNEGNQMATGRGNERIYIYNGNTVVVQWQQQDGDGRPTNFMETWVKDGNQWKAASAQVSNIQAQQR